MFNILLKQIDKQINYKVTSDKAISHNLLVNSVSLFELSGLNLICFKNYNR